MGLTYAKIRLVNQYDEYKSAEGNLEPNQIRNVEVEMLVDTSAIRMAINEEILNALGLKRGFQMQASLADRSVRTLELVSGIKVSFGDRTCYTDAFVLPGNTEPLLGAIPIEAMDLAVIPSENKLQYNPQHPDGALFSLK
ncbi:MAG: retroviral-like aspartic protease family protein [Bacteroidota bacterium]